MNPQQQEESKGQVRRLKACLGYKPRTKTDEVIAARTVIEEDRLRQTVEFTLAMRAQEAQIRRLKKENESLKEENEILKKRN